MKNLNKGLKAYKRFKKNNATHMQIHVRRSVQWTDPTQVLHILLSHIGQEER